MLLVFGALLEKSGNPQNYVYQLAEFYRATRDFRLLEGLSDAVVGHTAGQVYPLLQNMDQVLREVQDEATADSLVERIAKVRERVQGSAARPQASNPQSPIPNLQSPSSVDLRALDLLEVLIERRAAELKNQPGPHGDRALAAMRRAFARPWTPGEPRLVADLLSGLGVIALKPLADEQVHELETLHQQATAGTIDRLYIAHALARCYWGYRQLPRAIDLLESSLAEYQSACGGVLPTAANGVVETFIAYLEAEHHFARGEKYLQEQLKHPAGKQQEYWLSERLYALYVNAIRNEGDVSLGSGQTLYRAVERKIRSELDTPDENHLSNLVGWLWEVYNAAHDRKLSGVLEDYESFVFKQLPNILRRRVNNNYQQVVQAAAMTGHNLAGYGEESARPREGLLVLITLMEQEPRWLEYVGQNAWGSHGQTLAMWREELERKKGELGNLEGRLLKIVLTELRRDLESRQAAQPHHVLDGQLMVLGAKSQDFLDTAEKVLAQDKNSGAAVVYITQYMYHGLHQFGLRSGRAPGRQPPRGPRRRRPVATRPVRPRAEAVRRDDPRARAARPASPRQRAISHLAHAGLLGDQAAGQTLGRTQADRRLFPRAKSLAGGRHGRAGQ